VLQYNVRSLHKLSYTINEVTRIILKIFKSMTSPNVYALALRAKPSRCSHPLQTETTKCARETKIKPNRTSFRDRIKVAYNA